MKELLLSWLTPANLAIAAGALVTLLGALIGPSKIRQRRIAKAVYHAHSIVKDIAEETPGEDAFDLVEHALAAADNYMLDHGWRPMRPDEVDGARAELKARVSHR